MTSVLCFISLLLFNFVHCELDGETSYSAVVTLVESNLTESVSQGTWFIDFYAPWCGHCKNLIPTWEEVAKELEKENIKTAKFDAIQANPLLMNRWGVKGFPTLILIRENNMYDYKESQLERSRANLVKFALEPNVNAQPVPAPISFLDTVFFYIEAVINDVVFVITRKTVAVCVVALFAFLVGTLFALLVLFPKNPAASKKQEPQQQEEKKKKE